MAHINRADVNSHLLPFDNLSFLILQKSLMVLKFKSA